MNWRRAYYRMVDLLRSLPGLSLYSLDMLIRKRKQLPLFQADIIRARRNNLGQGLPAAFPEQLFEYTGELSLPMGGERADLNWIPDYYLAKILILLSPKAAFEIGTYLGTRTKLIAGYSAMDVRVYTLDLPPEPVQGGAGMHWTDHHMIDHGHRQGVGAYFKGTVWERNIQQLFGDSKTFDFRPYYDQIDLVFIDGSHSYPYVVSDTTNAVRMLRPGGVVVWDDYDSARTEYGTTRYLDKLSRMGWPVYRLGMSRQYAVMRLGEEDKKKFLACLPS